MQIGPSKEGHSSNSYGLAFSRDYVHEWSTFDALTRSDGAPSPLQTEGAIPKIAPAYHLRYSLCRKASPHLFRKIQIAIPAHMSTQIGVKDECEKYELASVHNYNQCGFIETSGIET
jgi:hypothetical protein